LYVKLIRFILSKWKSEVSLFCNSVAIEYLCISVKPHINWDALGVSATVACAIHCALLPLFLTSLPLFGVNILGNSFFEAGMILLALLIGGNSLWHGYRRHHHKYIPLVLFIAGIFFLALKQFSTELHLWLLIPAIPLIVSAHYLNWRYCRLAKHCHSSDCNH
jgi:MerC mercury resistance protein